MTESTQKIKVYGTNWCYDSRRARQTMEQNNIEFDYFDIDVDMEARKYVETVNRGFRSVPTIVFPDGSMLVEPSISELNRKLGLG